MTEKTPEEQAVIDATKLDDFMESVYEALDHVAAANYASRETEARQMIRDAYNKLIAQPLKTDWSKVPFGARVMSEDTGIIARFLGVNELTGDLKVYVGGVLDLWDCKTCSIRPELYTAPVWHKWTGERPDWVQDYDWVIVKHSLGGLTTNTPLNLNWQSRAIEFAVLKEQD